MIAGAGMTMATRPSRGSTDRELAQAAFAGDEAARRAIAVRLLTPVRATVSYLAGGGADAEDLAQGALIEILVSLGSFRGESTLEHWAKRIAAHMVYKHLEKSGRRRRLREQSWVPARIPRGVDDRVELKAARARLSALLQRISPEIRTSLVMHFVEGYTAAWSSPTSWSSPRSTARVVPTAGWSGQRSTRWSPTDRRALCPSWTISPRSEWSMR
jgi:RNA polymerase sigma-70 factor (ECF subfamily)